MKSMDAVRSWELMGVRQLRKMQQALRGRVMLVTDERDAQAFYGLGGKIDDASSGKAIEIAHHVTCSLAKRPMKVDE